MTVIANSTFSRAPRPVLVLAALIGALFAAAVSLWAYYGTDVFFEMVRNGWLACF